jgi:hypothetical protein
LRAEPQRGRAADRSDRYVVPAGAMDAWRGWDGSLAAFADGAWTRFVPGTGWRAFIADEGAMVVWTGAEWKPLGGEAVRSFESLGVNTAPEAGNRLAVKADNVLFSHDDVTPGSGNVHLTLNRAGGGREAAIFFKQDWQARAALGNFGDETLQIRVSPDGAAWRTALSVSPSDGRIGIGTSAPDATLHVEGSLSKLSGSFDIPHPDPLLRATHRLRHCFVEAPTRGENLYRFSIEAKAPGRIALTLPAYWRHLNENPQVWVNPQGHFGRAHGSLDDDMATLIVECDAAGRYNVLLIGTRTDPDARAWFDGLGVEYTPSVDE